MDELNNDVVTLGGNVSETTKEDWNDFWEGDGFSVTGNPAPPSPDVINFSVSHTGSRVLGGMGKDALSMSIPTSSELLSNFNFTMNQDTNRYKYSEDVILKELQDYIYSTYSQHYSAGDAKIQTLDLINACGDAEAFCRSNILKYASRYDKKGTARRDIIKILHYAVLLMHFNDKNAQRETYPQ
jgi:hypothetical protein